ncbi:plasmid partitioning protein RepB [Pseudoruegeria sp. SK021]|uniref:plasmid partitioning protein RepB n=1 Tax=Pseudoruegeria sp. SK021 TaxID=1933035 RepID=UPI000A23A38B|nr:plasmid partitioning protein RepB [Pseudoruegeria sp. SK021]OSP54137.1 plasmid partitioning protein RepB [Pseudoruegeria sp. SK021]
MARKDLLKGLMTPIPEKAQDPDPDARVDIAKPRYTKGAIGAVSQSIAALKSRALTEIDPQMIDAGGLTDRIDFEDEDHASLMESLRTYGQQVPILVRPHPDHDGRFQIVYGRRRVLALRELGIPAKAMIRDLDDASLIMAQGQENSARKDLTFIEKCNFARQMRDAGYDRAKICDALSIDKTLISRMLSVVDRIDISVIEAIGSAPSIGRDRWLTLADLIEKTDLDPGQIAKELTVLARGDKSVDRFEAAIAILSQDTAPSTPRMPAKGPRASTQIVKSATGLPIGRVTAKSDAVILTLPRDGNGGFEDWLIDHLKEFHRQWVSQNDENNGPQ